MTTQGTALSSGGIVGNRHLDVYLKYGFVPYGEKSHHNVFGTTYEGQLLIHWSTLLMIGMRHNLPRLLAMKRIMIILQDVLIIIKMFSIRNEICPAEI